MRDNASALLSDNKSGVRRLRLTNGLNVKLDEGVYHHLKGYGWVATEKCVDSDIWDVYRVASIKERLDGQPERIYMKDAVAQLLCGGKESLHVEFVGENTLDMRRENLKITEETVSQKKMEEPMQLPPVQRAVGKMKVKRGTGSNNGKPIYGRKISEWELIMGQEAQDGTFQSDVAKKYGIPCSTVKRLMEQTGVVELWKLNTVAVRRQFLQKLNKQVRPYDYQAKSGKKKPVAKAKAKVRIAEHVERTVEEEEAFLKWLAKKENERLGRKTARICGFTITDISMEIKLEIDGGGFDSVVYKKTDREFGRIREDMERIGVSVRDLCKESYRNKNLNGVMVEIDISHEGDTRAVKLLKRIEE